MTINFLYHQQVDNMFSIGPKKYLVIKSLFQCIQRFQNKGLLVPKNTLA